ncbi:MAG TPA: hypothetical protein VFH68_13775 [Polyangia bacterium]|jgi:YD repeat-containing protein|nr:hypothetical protein [Polyangia bacterium]
MTETIDPIGNTVTTAAYDANLGRRLSYADSRGNRIAVREFNTVGTATTVSALTTRYTYDPLDEMLTATDANANVTAAVRHRRVPAGLRIVRAAALQGSARSTVGSVAAAGLRALLVQRPRARRSTTTSHWPTNCPRRTVYS